MSLEINIDAKAVEQHVADAVLESAIGNKIKKTVAELLAKSWDNPIDKALDSVVREVAMKCVREHFYAEVEAAVKAKMTTAAIEKMVDNFWQAVYNHNK